MITNLFSVFDPSTGIFSMNWLRTFIGILIFPIRYWILPSRFRFFNFFIVKSIYNEIKILIGLNYKGNSLIFVSLFLFILFNNFFGLLPYVFTRSSHLVFTMRLSLPLWFILIIYGWLNKTNKIFYHLIPLGTPPILIPFIVCIETVRNIIRPGSLAVRLTANMIAGHLLIRLLGRITVNLRFYLISFIILIHFILMVFEIAVSIIQAYVFIVLSTLYSREI